MNTSILTKQNIRRIILFLAIAGVIFLTISIPFGDYRRFGHAIDWTIKKEMEMEAEKEDAYEVLFFGDSISLSAFYPDVLEEDYGIRSYNCATEGQWLGDTKTILEYALTMWKPKLIVLEANCIYREVSEEDLSLAKIFPLLRYHLAPMFCLSYSGRTNPTKGFKDVDTSDAYTGPRDYMNSANEIESLPEQNIKVLEEIYSYCVENNIALMVASAPMAHSVTNGQWTSWTNGKHAAVQSWCDEHQIEYIDYNYLLEDIGFDWNTDTRDRGDHVNKSGATKVTLYLGDKLIQSDLFQNEGGND